MENYLKTPLWNPELTMEERLRYLLSEMTMEEKLQCMGTGCPEIPRLGVPKFYLGGEGAHGVQARNDQGKNKGKPKQTTIFPNPIGMCATWDPDLIRQAGHVTGTEARALYNSGEFACLSLWAPTVDMERDPRWGRTEEGYGEDPVLAGAMAGAYVEGMQGNDPEHLLAAATVKHFYANNKEEGRCWTSSAIDARNREEYYLEPFRRLIQEHGAEGLMTAYNEINGIPCMLNPEVREIAKEQWGLHHVVCDGGDVSQTVDFHHYFSDHADTIAAGLQAGIDCFTDDDELVEKAATAAWERGMIQEEQIEEALYHHFAVMLRLGLFDPPGTNPYQQIGMESVGKQEHHRIARQVAAEAVVLLKNDRQLLPIPSGRSIAAIGPLADVWYKDWYSGIPPYYVTPAKGLIDEFGSYVTEVESGLEQVRIRVLPEDASVKRDGCRHTGRESDPDCEAYYLGLSPEDGTLCLVSQQEAESFQIEYWGDGRITLRSCSNGKLLTTEDDPERGQAGMITATVEEAFGWFVREVYHISRSDRGGMADQEIQELRSWNDAGIFLNEEGKLCVSMEAAEEVPAAGVAGYQGDAASAEETEGLSEAGRADKNQQGTLRICLEQVRDGIGRAAEAAANADVALLYLGANPMISCKEEIDRSHLELPPYQQELMEAVYEANPDTVLVLVSSVPFAIGWAEEHLPAILNTASGGMELGHGITDVLAGRVSPAARLPLTWYHSADDLPPMDDYDIIQGERTYQYFRGDVLYPFGHGLSYAHFRYEDLRVAVSPADCAGGQQPEEFPAGADGQQPEESPASVDGQHPEESPGGADGQEAGELGLLRVSVELRNVSERISDEVVQLYGRKINPVVKRPVKTLLAFRREKQIAGGEKRTVSFEVPISDLQYYSEEQGHKVLEPGEYEIMAGASSSMIFLQKRIVLS